MPGLDRFPFSQIARWLIDGEVVPFLGAGASRAGGSAHLPLPGGPALAADLVATMEGAFPDAANSAELTRVAQVFERSVFDRSALYDLLHQVFEVAQRDCEPAAVARTLARVPRVDKPMFVLTTNYDSYIERAMRDAGRPVCVITQNMRDVEKGATRISLVLPDGSSAEDESVDFQWNDRDRFPLDTVFVFKMHGSTHRVRLTGPDDIIITEDDYVDFMINAGGAVSPYFPPPSLTAAYKQRRFLFLGYSLADWNFRTFLRVLAIRNALSGREARRHWALQLDPDPLDVELWRHRNVTVFDGDLVEFCDRLLRGI